MVTYNRSPAQMALSPGIRLGVYEIIDLLGSGGMGEVYRARDKSLGRTVAIKVLRPELLSDPASRRRFVREARTAAGLNHPNIATIYSVDDSSTPPFIAMELVDGRTLRALIAAHPLSILEALDVAIGIADALCEAHRMGIVHRDLKPENVVVGSNGRVKVLDFGIARLQQPDGPVQPDTETETGALTGQNVILGTTFYMSPEQIKGAPVDARSDIFSFGTTVYEMLTGRLPFERASHMDAVVAILTEPPAALSRFTPNLPLGFAQIVGKCLEKAPEKRFQRTDELLVDLRRLRGEVAATRSDTGRKKLVVLPFENLGRSDEEYFASGITEEITSRLAVVRGLGVISRTTAMQYDKCRRSIRQIGEELGVDYVLEGTVRWAGGGAGASRVRITPQLIRVSDDTHVWADRYDRVMDDVFEIQSEIAERVTAQLGIVLLAGELKEVRDKPTKNLDAYEAYLRGLYYERPRGFLEERDRQAVKMLERAVQIDPDFALAHAELAITHAALYHYGFDHSADRLASATRAVEQAARLAPESPRVHLALGYCYYWCRRDYDRAFAEFAVALDGMPGNSEVLAAMGFVRRRQARWKDALGHFEQARELNPMDTHFAIQLADTLKCVYRYEEAEPYYDQSIRFMPDQVAAYVAKADLMWASRGDTAGARAVLEAMPAAARDSSFGFIHWFWQEIFEGSYDAALNRLSAIPSGVVNPAAKAFLAGQAYRLSGDETRSREQFETARPAMEDASRRDPEDHWGHAALAILYAGLGRPDEAIREAERAIELCSHERDPLDAPVFVRNLALVLAMTGRLEASLDHLEHLMAARQGTATVEYLPLVPSTLSPAMLRLDPRWKPLWEHPRFKKMT